MKQYFYREVKKVYYVYCTFFICKINEKRVTRIDKLKNYAICVFKLYIMINLKISFPIIFN